MTTFDETDAGDAFIATADSRNTGPEIMKAIAFFARNQVEAEALWNGDGIDVVATLTDIWENATNNGRLDDTKLFWGDRTLAEIMRQSA